jgi:hypothetical protein
MAILQVREVEGFPKTGTGFAFEREVGILRNLQVGMTRAFDFAPDRREDGSINRDDLPADLRKFRQDIGKLGKEMGRKYQTRTATSGEGADFIFTLYVQLKSQRTNS